MFQNQNRVNHHQQHIFSLSFIYNMITVIFLSMISTSVLHYKSSAHMLSLLKSFLSSVLSSLVMCKSVLMQWQQGMLLSTKSRNNHFVVLTFENYELYLYLSKLNNSKIMLCLQIFLIASIYYQETLEFLFSLVSYQLNSMDFSLLLFLIIPLFCPMSHVMNKIK